MTPIQPPAPTLALDGLRVILRRTWQAVLLASLVSSLCFAMTRLLPGDMAMRIAAGRHGPDLVNLAAAQAVHEELGLGRPAWQAWLDWQWQLAQLNLGTSWVSGQSVWREVSHQLGATLELSLAAVALAMLLGLPLGVVAGLRPMGWVDKVSMALAVWFKATPTFLLAVLLMLGVAVHLGILPVGGDAHAQGLALPALTLALGLAAGLARITRQAVQAAVSLPSHEFMRTKGLSDAQAWWRHGWRHASVPVLNYLGVQAVFLIEGAVVVESLFAWPGIGHALVHAIFGRDIPMIQGTALCMGLCVVACNLMVDALGRLLDPRPTWNAAA